MTSHADGPTITADVVIIGSGMGGRTRAYGLRNKGVKVLILERGGILPREPENWSPAAVFKNKRYRTTEHFLDRDRKLFRPSFWCGVGGNTKV